jgi:hypothetical protein
MKMIDVFTGLLLVALIGGGFLIARRLFDRRNLMNPPMEMPWQSEYGPRHDYGPVMEILATADLPMARGTVLPDMGGQCMVLATRSNRV